MEQLLAKALHPFKMSIFPSDKKSNILILMIIKKNIDGTVKPAAQKEDQKLFFKTYYRLMQVKSIALRSLFCLFLSVA